MCASRWHAMGEFLLRLTVTGTRGRFSEEQYPSTCLWQFRRLLGKYVRDEQVIPLEEAVRRLSGLPAENLGLERRGRLTPGHYADVVVFDHKTIQDHATFDRPHQYASGVQHVFVNGTQYSTMASTPTPDLVEFCVAGAIAGRGGEFRKMHVLPWFSPAARASACFRSPRTGPSPPCRLAAITA